MRSPRDGESARPAPPKPSIIVQPSTTVHTESAERLQVTLVRALAVLRGGDELEALRVLREHLRREGDSVDVEAGSALDAPGTSGDGRA